MKQQLRDYQADVSHKLNEIVSLKASLKENTAKVERLEQQNKDYEDKLHSCTREVEVSTVVFLKTQRFKKYSLFLKCTILPLNLTVTCQNRIFFF